MKYYVGWDVGSWHCDSNARPRDALYILRSEVDRPAFIGTPWRGNLRPELNALEGLNLARAMLQLCQVDASLPFEVVIAIDTPLGWPQSAIQLFTGGQNKEVPGEFRQNPYLFRETERFLSAHGFEPLSAVKDMIGSQSTKGLHFLRALHSQAIEAGVWETRQDGSSATAIETYPSPCQESGTFRRIFSELEQSDEFQHQQVGRGEANRADIRDALQCAVIAWLYAERTWRLAPPIPSARLTEGWIWVPEDALVGTAGVPDET